MYARSKRKDTSAALHSHSLQELARNSLATSPAFLEQLEKCMLTRITKKYGTVEDGIEWEIAEQPLL